MHLENQLTGRLLCKHPFEAFIEGVRWGLAECSF